METFELFMIGTVLFLTLPLGVALGALAIVARNKQS